MGSLLESTSSSGRYKLYRRQYWVCSPGNRDWENSGAHKTYSGLAYLFLLLIKKSLLLLSIRLLPAHPLTWALVPFLEFVYLFAFGIGDGLAIAVCKWLYVSKECLIGKPFSTHAERTAMETVKLKFFFSFASCPVSSLEAKASGGQKEEVTLCTWQPRRRKHNMNLFNRRAISVGYSSYITEYISRE